MKKFKKIPFGNFSGANLWYDKNLTFSLYDSET